MFVGETTSKGMIEFGKRIPMESIIKIVGTVEVPEQAV